MKPPLPRFAPRWLALALPLRLAKLAVSAAARHGNHARACSTCFYLPFTVIAGEEEGVFGWLTANKLQGRLPKDPSQAYVGALDMGGASTQITFAPSSSLLANAYHVGLENQVQADVYTHSFLYFGLDKARWRTNQVVLLNTTQSAGGSWPHPCWLQNGSTPYQLTVNGVGDDVPFTGAGDWQACLNAVNYLMNKATVCLTDALDPATLQPATALPAGGAAGLPAGGRLPTINAAANSSCSVNGVYQPPLGQVQFYAFSGYSYLYEFFGLSAGSTPSDLARAGEHFCGLDLAAAQAEHPGQDEEFLTTYCFTAAYVYSLWTTGYGFAPDSTNIHVVTGANASDYSYAFGSMISEANAMAWSYDGGKPAPAKAGKWQLVGIAMICIASIATLAAFLLAFKVGLCCKREASPTTLKGDSFNIQGEQEASLVGRSSLDVHQGAAV